MTFWTAITPNLEPHQNLVGAEGFEPPTYAL